MKSFDRWPIFLMLAFVVGLTPLTSQAQHRLIRFNDAPGVIAQKRLLAEPTIAYYEQPVRVVLPDGGQVTYWDGGSFSPTETPDMLVGMQVGSVYQLKVSAILKGQSVEVFPTVEMIDRLYPPEGFATRHPVKIVLSATDVREANSGNLVTKVVYLENPDTALPYRQNLDNQSTVDVGQGDDPYSTADKLGRPMAIIRVGSRQPSSDPGEAQFQIPTQMFVDDSFAAANPMFDASNQCNACQPVFSCCPEDIQDMPKSRRDEYVCDGHDRELAVVVGPNESLRGLDLEDTVAHFEKPNGETVVAPSNRVCIYSPRFAAVRRIMGSNHTTITQRLSVVNERTQLTMAKRNESSSTALQNVQLQSNKMTQIANQFQEHTRGVVADNVIRLFGTRHFFKPFEDLQLIRFGNFVDSESTRISLGMQSAIAWNSDLSAQISLNNQQPVIVNDVSQVQEMVSVETKTSSDLRLCKLASAITAKPGEIVDFTIRFDNIGRTPIQNVTIVDNLSPRLEYVKDSAECSVEASFSETPNEAGSATLKWKIEKSLQIRDGGIIRFQCRVR